MKCILGKGVNASVIYSNEELQRNEVTCLSGESESVVEQISTIWCFNPSFCNNVTRVADFQRDLTNVKVNIILLRSIIILKSKHRCRICLEVFSFSSKLITRK